MSDIKDSMIPVLNSGIEKVHEAIENSEKELIDNMQLGANLYIQSGLVEQKVNYQRFKYTLHVLKELRLTIDYGHQYNNSGEQE